MSGIWYILAGVPYSGSQKTKIKMSPAVSLCGSLPREIYPFNLLQVVEKVHFLKAKWLRSLLSWFLSSRDGPHLLEATTLRSLSCAPPINHFTWPFVLQGQKKNLFYILNLSDFRNGQISFLMVYVIRSGPPRIISLLINWKSTD